MSEAPRLFPSRLVIAALVAVSAFIVALVFNENRIQRRNASKAQRQRQHELQTVPSVSGGTAKPAPSSPTSHAELPQACREYLGTLERWARCRSGTASLIVPDHDGEERAVLAGERTEKHCRDWHEAMRATAAALGC